MNRSLLTYI
jgi:hypothetical protein